MGNRKVGNGEDAAERRKLRSHAERGNERGALSVNCQLLTVSCPQKKPLVAVGDQGLLVGLKIRQYLLSRWWALSSARKA